MRRACIAGLCVLLAAGCERVSGRPATTADTLNTAAAASGAEAFFRGGMVRLDATRGGLRRQLGAPDSAVVTAVKNRHDPAVTDSIAVVHYPGLAVELYLATLGDAELTSSIRLTDNRYIVATAPVRIGMPASDLESILGTPTETDGSVQIYLCDTCTELGNDQLLVDTTGGRVSAITLQYSID
ncbi:MAG TPA: hypothetical protein VF035_00200 [Longimicrobiales bacterium]